MKDRIEKQIKLKAPFSKVWHALIDHREFGKWFCVKIERPFIVGHTIRGKLTYPGYEHYPWEIIVQKIEREHLFSFSWHPYAIDTKRDYSKEAQTLVEFRLEKIKNGTLLLLIESGFDKIPNDRRLEAFSMNDKGCTEQMRNIENYIEKK